jgi:hypothetical protein
MFGAPVRPTDAGKTSVDYTDARSDGWRISQHENCRVAAIPADRNGVLRLKPQSRRLSNG